MQFYQASMKESETSINLHGTTFSLPSGTSQDLIDIIVYILSTI